MSHAIALARINDGIDLTLASYEQTETLALALAECLGSNHVTLRAQKVNFANESDVQTALNDFGGFADDYYANKDTLAAQRDALANFLLARGFGN